MAGILEIFGIKKRDPISLAIEEAIGLMNQENVDEAIQILEDRAVGRDPEHRRAILHLGVCHMLKKDYDQAERLLVPLTERRQMDSEKAAASIALEKIAKMRQEDPNPVVSPAPASRKSAPAQPPQATTESPVPPLSDELVRARMTMITRDLAGRGITDARVMEAMHSVRRDLFVPESARSNAYGDSPLPIGGGQTISQPYIVALMTESLAIDPGMRILEIGTGSGYQTAVLVEMGAEVYTMERLEDLSLAAEHVLDRLGYGERVTMRVDDGTLGWPEAAPFDRILVTAAGPKVPEVLLDQLTDNGRLLMPIGEFRGDQNLVLHEKTENGLNVTSLLPVSFVPLLGENGF